MKHTAKIYQDHDFPCSADHKFKLLQNAFNSYETTKLHLRRYASSRMGLEKNNALKGSNLKTWLGAEAEMVDALKSHRLSLLEFTKELDNLSVQNRLGLSAKQHMEFKRIQTSIEREAESEEIEIPKPHSNKTSKRSAYEQGAHHGRHDGRNGKPRNYRPSLLKAVMSDTYRRDYVRGYSDSFRAVQRTRRRKELGFTVSGRHQTLER